MFFAVVFIFGLAVGAGSEKTNELFNKAISKGTEVTQSVKTKAVEVGESAKSKAIELKDKIQK